MGGKPKSGRQIAAEKREETKRAAGLTRGAGESCARINTAAWVLVCRCCHGGAHVLCGCVLCVLVWQSLRGLLGS